jgi:hypothetical protein
MKTNLFGLYKQYKDQARLYIEEEVVHVPMMTTARQWYGQNKFINGFYFLILSFDIQIIA